MWSLNLLKILDTYYMISTTYGINRHTSLKELVYEHMYDYGLTPDVINA